MTTPPVEFRLKDLIPVLEPLQVHNASPVTVTSLTADSRRVRPGALFVAVPGTRADGHSYIPQALQRGAAALVCERVPEPLPPCSVLEVENSRRALSALANAFYGRPSRELRVTGVTGTDGKTSTTEILRTILNAAGARAGAIGTLGYWIDGRWTEGTLTTPEPVSLHESLHRMRRLGLRHVCMEVSSHSLVQHRVAHVDFDVAILTNITQDHLDMHGTRASYARAKRLLFEQLQPGAVAVLPAGGEFTDDFRRATAAEVLTYGTDRPADVRGQILSMDMDGMEILVQTPFEVFCLRTPLIGAYNCLNILAATTAAFAHEVTGEAVQAAMGRFAGVPGRLEKVAVPGRADLPAVCVDYAHTPDALDKVLSTLRPLVSGRLVCVVGCGGDRDKTKRPIMGRIATRRADLAVFTADNSRSERTEDIIARMLAGVEERRRCRVEPDRLKAIELAVRLAASPDSMVVICGKGCERHQDLGGRKIPFDDRVVARQTLERMPLRRKKTA